MTEKPFLRGFSGWDEVFRKLCKLPKTGLREMYDVVEDACLHIMNDVVEKRLVCTFYFSIFWIEAWQSASSRMAELLTKEEKDKLVEQRMEQMKKKNEAIRWDLLSVCQNLTGCLVDFTTIRFILIVHIPETYFLWCILSTLGLAGCVTILFILKC